jgi:hypothetical protein
MPSAVVVRWPLTPSSTPQDCPVAQVEFEPRTSKPASDRYLPGQGIVVGVEEGQQVLEHLDFVLALLRACDEIVPVSYGVSGGAKV